MKYICFIGIITCGYGMAATKKGAQWALNIFQGVRKSVWYQLEVSLATTLLFLDHLPNDDGGDGNTGLNQ